MRKDKGLNGDIDRLPILVWLFFLKFLDDNERLREAEAQLSEQRYSPLVDEPYRWRDWAAKEDGLSGDELISFVANEETVRCDGTRGPGLFFYLRSLKGISGIDQRDVIASIFRGVTNRMVNGYILRDVINKINSIHFEQSDEVFVLGRLYENLLLEMWDAAGDAGEFYTPRPLVRAIVHVMRPSPGEKILDPACGTGGFLVEGFQHVRAACSTPSEIEFLQREALIGGEAKPLPYLLCQMNLLLHGVSKPNIDPSNSLRFNIREIGESERVDVIMTNPPFGGEEEHGIRSNFPIQSQETTLLFLQLIMRKLKRSGKGGRAAVVVPSGLLFGDGVYSRVKAELLENFNLHTVLRLPAGVFSPYTGQETSVLFFDTESRTTKIWFYEHPLPPARQALKHPCYTKSNPLVFEEFKPWLEWWDARVENEFAWSVDISEIVGTNLDLKNPLRKSEQKVPSAAELVEEAQKTRHLFAESLESLNILIRSANSIGTTDRYPLRTLLEMGVEINPEARNPTLAPDEDFIYVDISSVSFNRIEEPKTLKGINAPSRARRVIRENDVLLSTVRPYLCGHAVVPDLLDDEIASTGFSVLRCPSTIDPLFLYYCLVSPQLIQQYMTCMRGAHYPALNDPHVKGLQLPEVPLDEQRKIAAELAEFERQLLPVQAQIHAYGNRLLTQASQATSVVIAEVLRTAWPEDTQPTICEQFDEPSEEILA